MLLCICLMKFLCQKIEVTYLLILSFIENIQAHLDKEDLDAGLFIDLKKTFDTVDHDIFSKSLNFMVREDYRETGSSPT